VAGAGTRFASLLNAELLDDLRKLYAARPERLRLSYLMMPDLLRESGSFGTLQTEGFSDKTARPAPRA
jgi:hypothetical protein